MSKQSRAKSRRHHNKKKVGTGATMTFEQSIKLMPENERYFLKTAMLDEIHRELCKKQHSWGSEPLNIFFCELWTDLEQVVMAHRNSKGKMRLLELINCIKHFYK